MILYLSEGQGLTDFSPFYAPLRLLTAPIPFLLNLTSATLKFIILWLT